MYEPPMYINDNVGGTPRHHPAEEHSRRSGRSGRSSRRSGSRSRSRSRSRSHGRGGDADLAVQQHQSAVLIEMAQMERHNRDRAVRMV